MRSLINDDKSTVFALFDSFTQKDRDVDIFTLKPDFFSLHSSS